MTVVKRKEVTRAPAEEAPGSLIKKQAHLGKEATLDVLHAIKNNNMSLTSSWREIEMTYGTGIFCYFKFAKDIAWFHVPLLALQLLFYVNIFSTDGLPMFPSYVSSTHLPLWRIVNMLSIALTFAFPIFYYYKTHSYYQQRGIADEDKLSNDVITENVKITSMQRIPRYALTYSVFLVSMVLQAAALIGLDTWALRMTDVKQEDGGSFRLTVLQTCASILITLARTAFDTLTPILTDYEKHEKISKRRSHNMFKFMLFRLSSVFILTFLQGYNTKECPIGVLGNMYLVYVMTDLILSNLLEWAVPIASWVFRSTTTKSNAQDTRPAWDTDQEYMEIIYRQFVIYSGLASFPMVTFIGLIIAALEIYLDLARLIYVCKKPQRTVRSMKGMVTAYMILSALLAVANWGGASLYTIWGNYWCTWPQGCNTCPIINN